MAKVEYVKLSQFTRKKVKYFITYLCILRKKIKDISEKSYYYLKSVQIYT